MANPTYEIRSTSHEKSIEHVSVVTADGEQTQKYSVYELWAIHDDGTEVFVCAHFGGCSHMAINHLKRWFEGLPIPARITEGL